MNFLDIHLSFVDADREADADMFEKILRTHSILPEQRIRCDAKHRRDTSPSWVPSGL